MLHNSAVGGATSMDSMAANQHYQTVLLLLGIFPGKPCNLQRNIL